MMSRDEIEIIVSTDSITATIVQDNVNVTFNEAILLGSSGDMYRSVYDPNHDGIVSEASHSVTADKATGDALGNDIISNYALKSEIPTALASLSEDATHRLTTDTEKEYWNNKLDEYIETDPVFLASPAHSITTDNVNILNNTSGVNTGDQDLSGYSQVGHQHSYSDITNPPTIPTQLSQLSGDVNHRTVTDAQINSWTGISSFDGDYNHLANIPTEFTPSTHNHVIADITDFPAIPTTLAELADDETHRLVTDTEKSAWNNKLDSFTETDPVFVGSSAYNITSDHITLLGNTSGTNTGDQDLSGLLPNSHLTDFAHSDIAHTNRTALDNVSGVNTGDQDLSGYSLTSHNHTGIYQPVGTYSTDIHSNITALNAVSGTNTGDNAVNSLYSGLATSKQDTLVSGTNIKTINGSSVLGSGDLTISAGGLTNFTESNYLYSTKYGVKLAVNSAQTNVDVVLQPKGTGGILVKQPDGTAANGNNRGQNALDLQSYIDANTQVASGAYSAILQGFRNTASGAESTVINGQLNVASGQYATVISGGGNTASGDYAVIAGESNTASSNYSKIGGGQNNQAKTNTYTSVVGGRYNQATGQYAVVCGGGGSATGSKNLASGTGSGVVCGNTNTASGSNSFVSNGYNNTVTQESAAIIGGNYNGATGVSSVVLGGTYNNTQSKENAVVMGEDAYGLLKYSFTMGYGRSPNTNKKNGRIFCALKAFTIASGVVELFADGSTQRLLVNTQSAFIINADIVINRSNGEYAFYSRRLKGYRASTGDVVIVSVDTIGADTSNIGDYSPTFSTTISSGYLSVTINMQSSVATDVVAFLDIKSCGLY